MHTQLRAYFLMSTLLVSAITLASCNMGKPKETQTQRQVPLNVEPVDTLSPQESEVPPEELCSFEPTLAGLKCGMDSLAVIQLLGRPDSITHAPDDRDSGSTLDAMCYPNLTVSLGSGNYLGGVALTTPAIPTSRGLRVGDSLSVARRLYGTPIDTTGESWYYQKDNDDALGNFLIIDSKDGLVVGIFAGHIYD